MRSRGTHGMPHQPSLHHTTFLTLAAFSSSALSCLGHTAQLAIQPHAQPLDGASGKGGPKLTPVPLPTRLGRQGKAAGRGAPESAGKPAEGSCAAPHGRRCVSRLRRNTHCITAPQHHACFPPPSEAAAAMEQLGQTRPGRISDAPPGAAAYASSAPAAADPAAFVNETVRGHKVAMFSKVRGEQCAATAGGLRLAVLRRRREGVAPPP